MNQNTISPIDPYERNRVTVLDTEISYVDTGRGEPIVFLHGNPTSSYLWRNIIPHIDTLGRCLAPDLIGMGQSGQNPNGSYCFSEHYRYLDAWFDAVGITENVIWVIHDWGSALGFNWAYQHRQESRVRGIAYMEAIVCPISWDELSEKNRDFFKAVRSSAGEDIILEKNLFVEQILPTNILRDLSDEEMAAYRQPYLKSGESRRPTLTWPREIPIDGKPEDMFNTVNSYGQWLAITPVPKLFINSEPGTLIGRQHKFCRTWANQDEVTVKGIHFIQEDSPHEIGRAIAGFVMQVRK